MTKRKRPVSKAPSVFSGEQRINKVLAAAGLGSRRQVDELIEQGRVEIDGQTIHQVGVKVDPTKVTISVDGESLKRHRPVYYILNKPEGVLCTNRDPEGRPRVTDMVPNQVRLFPVGRLDASSTGLILLTNDGELAQRLAHPKHGVSKRYAVVVVGQVEADSLRRLQRGIHLAEGRAKVDHAKVKRLRKGCTELEITLSEGKNREIRRVLARLGHKVVSLQRVGIGPLKLGDLPEGAYRQLSSEEAGALYGAVEEIKRERRAEKKARKQARAEQIAQEPDEPALLDSDEDDFDTLPPISANPYRTEEDLDDEDDFGDDSVLVRDHGWDDDEEITSLRAGSVIGDEDEFVEEVDDDFGAEDGSEQPRTGRKKGTGRGDRNASRGERKPGKGTKSGRSKFGKPVRNGRGESASSGSLLEGGRGANGPSRKSRPNSGRPARTGRPNANARDRNSDSLPAEGPYSSFQGDRSSRPRRKSSGSSGAVGGSSASAPRSSKGRTGKFRPAKSGPGRSSSRPSPGKGRRTKRGRGK